MLLEPKESDRSSTPDTLEYVSMASWMQKKVPSTHRSHVQDIALVGLPWRPKVAERPAITSGLNDLN